MGASRYRDSVVLQRDSGGTWEDVAQLFAEITYTGGADGGASGTYAVVVPWGNLTKNILPSSDLKPTHRLAWGSRVLEIFDVENIEQRNREVRMECKELPAVAPE